jgi:protein-L-isoaspartate(D-aspartate) O-methyltransferase
MSGQSEMLQDIEREVEFTRTLIGKRSLDPRVMAAMGAVPRRLFVPMELQPLAYQNGPLPIGHGQTISQPYIVALMTDLLAPQPEDVILEIGTGSGYQAAILASLVRQVYSLEIVAPLSKRAAQLLAEHGYENVQCRIGDGYYGWPDHAPYDGIIVTAAAAEIPPPLIEQLKPEGRLVIPVGAACLPQELVVVEKRKKGQITTRRILDVAFVPLTGGHDNNRED